VAGVSPAELAPGFVEVLHQLGLIVTSTTSTSGPGGVTVAHHDTLGTGKGTTAPHPGFPTDLQPQLTAFLSQVEGRSVITETLYDQRDTRCSELRKLGIRVQQTGPHLSITGRRLPTSGTVNPQEIRCAAAMLVLAAAGTHTTTLIDQGHLARGYADFLSKLRQLGFDTQPTE